MTMTSADDSTTIDSLIGSLARSFGQDRVLADDATRDYYANDIFWQPGIRPLAVVLPQTPAEVAEAVKAATDQGIAVVPRGAGMSYTKGYLPARAQSIVVDMRKMNRVLEVNVDDLYVTAEAGCTWEQLNESLEGTGLRTAYWGPLSGIVATVGGALSQNSAFFGSARNGTVAEAVLGVTVVLADGRAVTTGSAGRKNTKPFTRFGGPDLTGMFLGDNGAFGIKVAATLRLWPRPTETGFLSFGFPSISAMAAAQVEMARTRLVSEGFGIDRNKVKHSASVNRISDGLKALGNVAKAGKSLLKGLKDAVDVAVAGSAFLDAHDFTLHIVTEAYSAEELKSSIQTLKAIGQKHGTEIENTIPKVMRSKPFSTPRGMLGLDGERWVPIHSVFPLSDAQKAVAANEAYFQEKKEFMKKYGIVHCLMTMTVGNEFFLEPAFYWHDEITPLHAASVGHDTVKPWLNRPANPESRHAVVELRRGCQELYASLGGASWQVARDYPFESILTPETWSLAENIKKALDPKGLMNPGSLGLAK
jgi:D-lactate dehydrogenase (cytochrome)